MQEYYTKQHIYCQNNTTHHGHKSNRKKLNISGGITDVAKQSLMAAGSGLLKAKGVGATPGQVIAAPELSNNLDQDRKALTDFNQALLDGATPAEAYADHLTSVSKAAQEAARQSNGLPVDIGKYANAQTAASMATKVSTGSMIAQSVASAALTGAISMGVTLAVNGLVMGLDYLAHAHERAVEAVDNANAAYAENESELSNASSSLAGVEDRLNALNNIKHKSLAEEAETEELATQCMSIENSVCANPNEWRRRCFLWQGDRMQKNTKAPAGSRGRAGRMSGAKKGVE